MKIKDLKEGYLYVDYDKRGHCKNGTFVVRKVDGGIQIHDTYWDDGRYFKPSEEYIKHFKEVLMLDEWSRSKWSQAKDYDKNDVIQVHYNQCSGRFQGQYMDYFIRKDAKKSVDKKIEQLEESIASHKRHLADEIVQLERLKSREITAEQVFIW